MIQTFSDSIFPLTLILCIAAIANTSISLCFLIQRQHYFNIRHNLSRGRQGKSVPSPPGIRLLSKKASHLLSSGNFPATNKLYTRISRNCLHIAIIGKRSNFRKNCQKHRFWPYGLIFDFSKKNRPLVF